MADVENTTARGWLQNIVGQRTRAQLSCEVRKFWKVQFVSRAITSDSFTIFTRRSQPVLIASTRRPWGRAAAVVFSSLLMVSGLGAQTPGASPVATPAASATASAAATAKEDLIGVLKTAGNFKTFLKAVEAADLSGTLQKPGPLTLFAPTDTAFSKMPAGTLDDLLKPENKAKLVKLLSYHVANGKLTATELAKADEVKTLEGTEIDVEATADGKTIEVDDAKILGSDIEASNGVLHAIDSVLQP